MAKKMMTTSKALLTIGKYIFGTILRLFVDFLCGVIYLVTLEPFSGTKQTPRKIRRIRCLTRFKIWLNRHMHWLVKLMDLELYYNSLERKFG